MKAYMAVAAILAATPAAADFSGRGKLGEVWVYPSMFQQALSPLAPLAEQAVKGGQCPGLVPGADKVVHRYDFDAKFKTRGMGENKRWEIAELKLLNPSGCAILDDEVTRRMRSAIPGFAEPFRDLDDNGWTRIPRIELRLTT